MIGVVTAKLNVVLQRETGSLVGELPRKSSEQPNRACPLLHADGFYCLIVVAFLGLL